MPNVTFVIPSTVNGSGIFRQSSSIVSLRSGDIAQEFRVYGNSTGPKFVVLMNNGTNSYLLTNDGHNLYLGTSLTIRWLVQSDGKLLAGADNTYDIGAAGANRPKDVYAVKYYGDGSALTGITGATGGISNTGSTTIASDSDASGNEDIAFQTSTVVRWLVKGGTGHFVPNIASTYDVGDATLKIRYVYANSFSNAAVISNTTYGANLSSTNRIVLGSVQSSGETSAGSIIDLATTWDNVANTPSAIKLNVLDTNSNAASNLMLLQVGGVNRFYISKAGVVYSAAAMLPVGVINGIGNSYSWTASSKIYGDSDGIVRLTDNAGTSFGRLQLGGTTSAFPSLKRSATTLIVRLADDSANAPIQFDYASVSTHIAIGTNPASAGAIRLANNTLINWRNQANGADIGGFSVGTDDGLYVGNAVAPAASGTRYLIINTAGKITSSASAPSGT